VADLTGWPTSWVLLYFPQYPILRH